MIGSIHRNGCELQLQNRPAFETAEWLRLNHCPRGGSVSGNDRLSVDFDWLSYGCSK